MISVVVPTRGNSPHLEECLKSLKKQTKKPRELIVVFDENASEGVEIARRYGAKVVFNKNSTIGDAYATGVKASKSRIIAFTDDDCVLPEDWIEKIEKEFQEDVDVVSGEDLLPPDSTFFQKAAYQIDKSRLMKHAVYGKKAKNRLRAANIAYRQSVFEKENFNPNLKGLQEPEFHHRLYKMGFKMKFDPELYVYHRRRSSLNGIFSQIYRNGKAKIDLLKLHRAMLSHVDLLPLIYAVLLIITFYYTLAGNIWYVKILGITTVAYFILKPIKSIRGLADLKYYPHLVLITFVRESAYGLGILAGIPRFFRRQPPL